MPGFNDPAAVANFADGPARPVPALHDLYRMMGLLLAERCGTEADILVLGAGGGLELQAQAEAQPGWRFTGVDPSAPMLDLARDRLGAFNSRIALHQGLIADAPIGPFDGATCLLTMHFVPREERLPTLLALRARLKPAAPLVLAHHSFPQDAAGKARWLGRHAAFAVSSGVPEAMMRRAVPAIGDTLPVLSPEQKEAVLRQAGFDPVELFYAAFSFRGWAAFNPS